MPESNGKQENNNTNKSDDDDDDDDASDARKGLRETSREGLTNNPKVSPIESKATRAAGTKQTTVDIAVNIPSCATSTRY